MFLIIILGKKNATSTTTTTTTTTKKVRQKKMNMRQLLLCKESGIALFGPEILDHCLLTAGIAPALKVYDFLASLEETAGNMSEEIELLQHELQENAPKLLALLDAPGQPGYILLRNTSTTTTTTTTDGEVSGDYYDFVPRMYKQHQDAKFIEFSSFDEAVDEYFCKVLSVTGVVLR